MTVAPVKAGGAYSHVVRITKIGLPLVALGILSLLVILARQAPRGEPLQFVDRDVAELAETQRLGAPRHAAVSGEGTVIDLSAERLWTDPSREDLTRGETLAGEFATRGGLVYDIDAVRGRNDETRAVSFLEDGVVIRVSNGYRLRTEAMRIRNDRTYLTSLAPVHGDGPLGTIDAGRMEIFADPQDNARTHVVFRDGVRVFYDPPEETDQ